MEIGRVACMSNRGVLIVLSGPSGVGKGTVRQAIFENYENDFEFSISMTTRGKRPGEVEGKDYFYSSREEFEELIAQDGLLEYAEYVDNLYGTPLKYVEDTLASGRDVFLEIEVQGAKQVQKKMPEGIFVFLVPPNFKELEDRLVHRGSESHELVQQRLSKAVDELRQIRYYDYVVVNDKVSNASRKVKNIIESEHLKVSRNISDFETFIKEME